MASVQCGSACTFTPNTYSICLEPLSAMKVSSSPSILRTRLNWGYGRKLEISYGVRFHTWVTWSELELAKLLLDRAPSPSCTQLAETCAVCQISNHSATPCSSSKIISLTSSRVTKGNWTLAKGPLYFFYLFPLASEMQNLL